MKQLLLPKPVRLRAASEGAAGLRWLDALPQIIHDLQTVWQLRVGEPLHGGSESVVLPVLRADDSPAVLKIGMPSVCDTSNEAHVLRLSNGRGYATLFAQSVEHNAILIEQLGPSLGNSGKSKQAQMEIICQTLPTAWIPLTESHQLMTGAEKARSLAAFTTEMWQKLDRPCAQATIHRALAYAEAREAAFDPARCVLVHGDAHEFNTLHRPNLADTAYKFVDPDGLFAEPAFDLAIIMRDWSAELLAGDAVQRGRARCEQLATLTGIYDHNAIWQWGFMERVSTGLVLLKIGMIAEGQAMLQVADLWAGADLRWA